MVRGIDCPPDRPKGTRLGEEPPALEGAGGSPPTAGRRWVQTEGCTPGLQHNGALNWAPPLARWCSCRSNSQGRALPNQPAAGWTPHCPIGFGGPPPHQRRHAGPASATSGALNWAPSDRPTPRMVAAGHTGTSANSRLPTASPNWALLPNCRLPSAHITDSASQPAHQQEQPAQASAGPTSEQAARTPHRRWCRLQAGRAVTGRQGSRHQLQRYACHQQQGMEREDGVGGEHSRVWVCEQTGARRPSGCIGRGCRHSLRAVHDKLGCGRMSVDKGVAGGAVVAPAQRRAVKSNEVCEVGPKAGSGGAPSNG